MERNKRETFGSRIGFILVSAGCAIGIGNVWKFPYVTGANGGAVFVLFYLLFLILMGIPVMTMELAIGRASRKTMVEGYKALEKKGSKWKTMPQQMLSYRAAAFFIRTVAPEISMGLSTTEEIVDTIEMAPDDHGAYATVDEVVAKVEAETKQAMENLADPDPSGPAPAEAPAEQPKKRPF